MSLIESMQVIEMTEENCEEHGLLHDFGEEVHEEIGWILIGTISIPPHKNTKRTVVRQYKQCKRCGFRLYV